MKENTTKEIVMSVKRTQDTGRLDSLGRRVMESGNVSDRVSGGAPFATAMIARQDFQSEEDRYDFAYQRAQDEVADRVEGIEAASFLFRDDDGTYISRDEFIDEVASHVADGDVDSAQDYSVVMSLRNDDALVNEANEYALGLHDTGSLPGGWSYDSDKQELTVFVSDLPPSSEREPGMREIISGFTFIEEDYPVLNDMKYSELREQALESACGVDDVADVVADRVDRRLEDLVDSGVSLREDQWEKRRNEMLKSLESVHTVERYRDRIREDEGSYYNGDFGSFDLGAHEWNRLFDEVEDSA